MKDDDLILVGRVARAHGNRGQVIVNLETDFAEQRFREGAELLVGPQGQPQPRVIRAVRFHQGRPVIALEGVDSMNDAEALAGADLWLRSAAIEALPPGTFYRHDLIGCEVRSERGERIGTVSRVEGTLERSYLVVAGGAGEVLIPMVADICTSIDPAARAIVVNPPEGLLELNETRRGSA